MTLQPWTLPDLASLSAGLRSLFGPTTVSVLERKANPYTSSCASEIVTCRSSTGDEFNVFCKYGIGYGSSVEARRRVECETWVYQHLLNSSSLRTLRCAGSFTCETTGVLCLALEFLDEGVALKKVPEAMSSAAAWIGRFHAQHTWTQNSPPRLPFLPLHGAHQYAEGAQRAVLLSEHLRYPWLAPLIEAYEQQFVPLLASANAIIHGDYFPSNNIMVQRGVVMPIDWGGTCIAVGEIDLAALTFGWPDEIEHECQTAYVRARWRHGAPDDFPTTLTAAQLFWLFRTVGTKKNWQNEKRVLRCLNNLHERATRLGLV